MGIGQTTLLIGAVVACLLAALGAAIGAYRSVKNTKGPRERAFMAKTALGLSVGVVLFLALFLGSPKLSVPLLWWVLFVVAFTVASVACNRRQARIKAEEAQSGVQGQEASQGAAAPEPRPTARNVALAGAALFVVAGVVLWRWSPGVQCIRMTCALMDGDAAAVAKRLDQGLPVMTRAHDGETFLQLAAWRGQPEVAKVLLDRGAELEAKDRHGRTPLFMAAQFGHAGVATLLLERGANVQARNAQGWTPLKAALAGGHTQVADILRSRGAGEE